MRTVSFSDRNVRNLLNKTFVNTFTNTTGDPTAGKSIWHSPDEPAGSCIRGNGRQNVQTLFLTPAGEIFHAATGYLSPEDLAEEIGFARDLFVQINGETEAPEDVVRRAHGERLAELGYGDREIESGSPFGPLDALVRGADDDPLGALGSIVKQQILDDNRFSIRHPLMGYQDFEKDPTALVGKGKTFFSSESNSSSSGEELDLDQLRKLLDLTR